MKEFSEILRELRIKENLSQEALGNIVHVSRSAIAKYENGLGLPSEEVIEALCKYFKVDKDYLFPKEDVEQLLIEKNNTIRSKKMIIFTLISIIILMISVFLISNCLKYRNLDNPVVTSLSLDDNIPVQNEIYYLTANQEYVLYFDIQMCKKTYEIKPKFYISSNFEVLQNPMLISEEKINTNEYKQTYKVIISTRGAFVRDETINIYWSYKENNFNGGPVCDILVNNIFKINSSLISTINVNFYFINKIIFTYKLEKGKSLNNILYVNSNVENLINALLNYELNIFTFKPFDNESNILNLLEFKFNGWILENGKSLDEPIFSDIDLYPDIPYIGDCNDLVVNDINLIGLHDYKTPIFNIGGNYTSNINYSLSSNSNIVSIKDNKFKLTDYGIAEITVEYDLGFYKGVRVFTVECKEAK